MTVEAEMLKELIDRKLIRIENHESYMELEFEGGKVLTVVQGREYLDVEVQE